ncbi:NAD-dependent dehydratase [Aureimonas sp. AU12]|uniref:NAD-dependent dehydratase n=1 Tax=Aureimonas sp. AU12 TaxID=1638161 RepID=UPI00078148D0|nr:NAD-dependent dehydratase [Aureimonas sp. AU12]
MRILLLGATGLVGGHVLTRLLRDERVTAVVAPVRRAIAPQPKLSAPLVDFERPGEIDDIGPVDAMISAFGTTIRAAGSQDAFRRVDHGVPLAVARLAYEHGARILALNSAAGADAASRIFYLRVKGELEEDLAHLGFSSLALIRPGLIGGERAERRTGEHVAGLVLGALAPVLPRRWRINPADTIAATLVEAAIRARPGTHVVSAGELA